MTVPFRMLPRVLALVLSAIIAIPGRSQPPQPAEAPPPPTPTDVLARLHARYRSGPLCERMRIEVRTDSGRVARSWVVVRTDAARVLVLELGSLKIAADDKSVVAVHDRNPQTCFTAPLPGDGPLSLARLWQVIPRVPVPQFDLAAASDASSITSLAVYARDIRWESATPDPRPLAGGPARVTLAGLCEGGRITMVVRGDQLQAMDIRDEVQGVTVRLQISPVLPCRQEDLRMETGGRTPVPQLSDLQPRSGVLRIGAAVPEMQLSTAAGQVQRLKDLYTPPAQFLPAPAAERLVLVFTRQGKDPLNESARVGRVEVDALGRELAKLQQQVYAAAEVAPGHRTGGGDQESPDISAPPGESAPLLPTFNFAQVMVLDSPPSAESLLGMIKRERRSWGGVGGGDHLAWTTSAKSSVDLFATSGESSVIVLSSDQRLQSAIRIADRTTTEELLDQIAAALLERTD